MHLLLSLLAVSQPLVKQFEFRKDSHKFPKDPDQGSTMQDLAGLANVIRQQVASTPVLVVFDNVWDGGIFRRGLLDIMPDLNIGGRPAWVVPNELLASMICSFAKRPRYTQV